MERQFASPDFLWGGGDVCFPIGSRSRLPEIVVEILHPDRLPSANA